MTKQMVAGLAVLLLVLNVATGGADKDQKDIQGTWQPVKVLENGNPGKETEKFQMVFQGTNFTIQKDGKEIVKGSFKLDSSKTPKHIDLKIEKSPGEDQIGKTAVGIFKLEGDMLTWCATKPGEGTRPTAFSSEAGSKQLLLEMKRVKK